MEFTAPAQYVDGRKIDDSFDMIVMQGDVRVGEILNVTPASPQSLTVSECLKNCYQSFHVRAVSSNGTKGFSSCDGAYIGLDIPGIPVNARLVADGDNAVITCEKPSEVGTAYGYVDTDNLTYYVQRVQTEEWVAYGTKEMSVTDFNVAQGDSQEFASYFIYALNEMGTDLPAMTNGEIFGKPYTLPYKESFANAKLEMGPWALYSNGGESKWNVTYTKESQDNDLGCTFYTPGDSEGDSSTLSSPKISLEGAVQPVLSFYYFNRPDSSTGLSLLIGKTHAEFKEVKSFIVNTETLPQGWTILVYPLCEYITSPSIQFGIKAITQGSSPRICL